MVRPFLIPQSILIHPSLNSLKKSAISNNSSKSRKERMLPVRHTQPRLFFLFTVVFIEARIKKIASKVPGGHPQTKFKVRCSRYLYTLSIDDPEKAEKLQQSLPPGVSSLLINRLYDLLSQFFQVLPLTWLIKWQRRSKKLPFVLRSTFKAMPILAMYINNFDRWHLHMLKCNGF